MLSDYWIEKESAALMGTYGRHPIVMEKGAGSTLYDVEGRSYIDFCSGIGVLSLGTADSGWLAAVQEQSARLAHISNLFHSEPMILLAEKLCALSGLKKVFFGNSGAEANEGAIKLARKYSFDKYGEGRGDIVTLVNSFHGRTMTTLAATGQEHFHNYFFPFPQGFAYAEAGSMEALQGAVTEHTCAVMCELIQGEGGVLPLEADYVQQVAEFCAQRDLLLIVDEIQTGVGRTGSLLACQQYKILPDVVTLAKGLAGGLPIGAVLAGEKCAGVLGAGDHGSTFGGNPVCCAAANYVLSVIGDKTFLAEVRAKGNYLREQILSWNLPAVKSIRGMGLMLGVIVEEGAHKGLAKEMVQEGVLVLTAGKDAVRLLPPLNISYGELDEGLAVMKRILEGQHE